jgi:large subunit ribosomal protein L21
MYAVIETGGKQYRVAAGESIEVESIPGNVGATVEFDRVIAVVDGDTVKAGASIESARVRGTIAEHGRSPKTLVFKFKRKKQYKRTIGHRQDFTRVTVNEIVA